MKNPIQIGCKVAYSGRYPWHIYHGRVIAEGIDPSFGFNTPSWRVRWDGDQYFPERAGTESWVPKYVSGDVFYSEGLDAMQDEELDYDPASSEMIDPEANR